MKPNAVLDLKRVPPSHRRVLEELARILRRERAQGYLVGGYLRDHLLGTDTCDLDFAVRGVAPVRVARALSRALGFSKPVVYPRFKTVLVAGDGLQVEILSLEGDLDTDASRRDFTVNCLYLDATALGRPGARRKILDPSGEGLRDIRARVLRTPEAPCFTLWLDPLRILRAVRFSAAAGFRLDPALLDAMARMAYLLTRPAAERVRAELEKILVSPRLPRALFLMQRSGINAVLLPELGMAYGFAQQTPYHHYDLFTHLAKTASYMPPDATLRLAGLLHDLGKLRTQTAREDRMVYYGHETVSRALALAIMKRLRFSNRAIDLVAFLAENHMINYSEDWSDKAVRRFARRMGAHLDDVLILAEADRKAQRPVGKGEAGAWNLPQRILDLATERGPGPELPVNGRDIMQVLGIRQGPLVGEAKAFLLEKALSSSRKLNRARAISVLKRWSKSQGEGRLCLDVDKNPKA